MCNFPAPRRWFLFLLPHTELPLPSFHSLRKANPGQATQHEEAPLAYFLSGNQICLCPTGNAEVRVKAYKGLFQNEHFPQRKLEFSHMEIEPTLFHLTFFQMEVEKPNSLLERIPLICKHC